MMRETGGDGVGRLVEATGATTLVNGSFSLLRYICIIESIDSISRDERDVPLTQYITNA